MLATFERRRLAVGVKSTELSSYRVGHADFGVREYLHFDGDGW